MHLLFCVDTFLLDLLLFILAANQYLALLQEI